MTSALKIGQPVLWHGSSYLVEACMTLSAGEFGWSLCDLYAAEDSGSSRLAMSSDETYVVCHGGDWEGMCEPGRHERDGDYLEADPPVEHGGGKLVRFGDAVYEANHQGGTLAFDRGRLLEYELGDGGRAVVFVSNRRWVEFEARVAAPEDLKTTAAAVRGGV